MRPGWLVLSELRQGRPGYLADGAGRGARRPHHLGDPEPEVTFTDWLLDRGDLLQSLGRVRPVVVVLDRDRTGRPRAVKLLETDVIDDRLRVSEVRPD